MLITEKTFEAFLKCATKSYLYFHDVVGVPSEFSQSQDYLREDYKQRCREQLCSAVRDGHWHDGMPDPQSLADRRYRLIFDYAVTLPEIHARLDALEGIRIASNGRNCPYIPIRFVPSEKLSTCDKLLLAFDAFAFSQVCGKTPQVGRIIHGCQYTMLTVPLAALLHRVRLVLRSIADQQAKSTTPLLALNKHCAQCEFQVRCRQIAIQKDDLSLLPTLSEKERKKQNARGIFSVLQLSYTFRSPRRSSPALLRHQPALRALAIRKNQIPILGAPTLSLSGTPVHIDVEGDPDRDFYYLVGLRIGSGGPHAHYSYWANSPADERAMWADCLHRLGMIASPRLMHFPPFPPPLEIASRFPHSHSFDDCLYR
jgi:predicted RecB family nuclease